MRITLSSILYLLSAFCLLAQPQVAWVARYNGGFANKSHTPLALNLDGVGNICVAGSSQNASNVSDYVVLKYTPSGAQLFATRYGSTNGTSCIANGFALDQYSNTYLTGTGGTVKLDMNGVVAWIAPYGGKDLAAGTDGNVYVTGFATNQYATVKLDGAGNNQWVRTYQEYGGPGEWRTESQKVAVDASARVYVAGWQAWGPAIRCSPGSTNLCRYSRPSMLVYDTAGTCLWTNRYTSGGVSWGETKGLIADNQGSVYLAGNGDDEYQAYKITASGQRQWTWGYGPPGVSAMVLDTKGNVYLTGGVLEFPNNVFGTFKLSNSGSVVWQATYLGDSTGYTTENRAYGIALDQGGNVYVAGVSTNATTRNDIVTIKYDSDGHELWVKRYNGPANGNDGATSIAVAPDGSIYVTGYSANEAGGSDIVTIKYVQSSTTIQKKTDGSMLLQGYGLPASNYTFQAATDLLSWDAIGSSVADTNGAFHFTDTNAPLFPQRFYRWTQP